MARPTLLLLALLALPLAISRPAEAQERRPLPEAAAPREELAAAERRLRAEIQLNPTWASLHASLADVLQRQGRLQEALDAYEEAIRLAPGDARFRARLAAALLESGRSDRAALHFREAVRLDPARAEYHAGLGEALRRQGLRLPAAQALRDAVRLDPDDPDLARLLKEVERGEDAGPGAGISSVVARVLSLAILVVTAAVLTVAGLAMLLPVCGAFYLLLVVTPLSLIRRHTR